MTSALRCSPEARRTRSSSSTTRARGTPAAAAPPRTTWSSPQPVVEGDTRAGRQAGESHRQARHGGEVPGVRRACPSTWRGRRSGGRSPSPRAHGAGLRSRCGAGRSSGRNDRREPVEALGLPGREDRLADGADGTSATTLPPPPAPVSFAPSAPGSRASPHRRSMLGRRDEEAAQQHLVEVHEPAEGEAVARLDGEARVVHERPDALERSCATTSGRRARRRATRVDHRLRARRGSRAADAEVKRSAHSHGSSASPLRKKTQPPRAATAASTPLGLPWKTRSHAMARACTASLRRRRLDCARDRDAYRRRAPEPAARGQVGLDLDGERRQRRLVGASRLEHARGRRARGRAPRRPRARSCSSPSTCRRLGPSSMRRSAWRARRGRCRPRSPERRRRPRARRAGSPCRTLRRPSQRSLSRQRDDGAREERRAHGASAPLERRPRLAPRAPRSAPRRARAPQASIASTAAASVGRRVASARAEHALERPCGPLRHPPPRPRAAVRLPLRRSPPAGLPVARGSPNVPSTSSRSWNATPSGSANAARAATCASLAPASCGAHDDRAAHGVARGLQRVHGLDLARVAWDRADVEELTADDVLLDAARAPRAARKHASGRKSAARAAHLSPAPTPGRPRARSPRPRARGNARASSPGRWARRAARRRRPSSRRGPAGTPAAARARRPCRATARLRPLRRTPRTRPRGARAQRLPPRMTSSARPPRPTCTSRATPSRFLDACRRPGTQTGRPPARATRATKRLEGVVSACILRCIELVLVSTRRGKAAGMPSCLARAVDGPGGSPVSPAGGRLGAPRVNVNREPGGFTHESARFQVSLKNGGARPLPHAAQPSALHRGRCAAGRRPLG